MKAIRITKENKAQLTNQYEMDEGFLDLSSGLYLVAGFGDHAIEGLLTKAIFDTLYTTGSKLRNGFFEVAKK
jgi:hypothetical protein